MPGVNVLQRSDEQKLMRRGGVRRALWLAFLVCGMTRWGLAHDPYEITSQAMLFSNRLELTVEMEFNAAMLLAGEGRGQSAGEAATQQFERVRSRLMTVARNFLNLATNGVQLLATDARVTLEVENHIRFVLDYPPVADQGFRVAPGELKSLGAHGQYGSSLTVLDMVGQRVLAQSVMFADSPALIVKPREEGSSSSADVRPTRNAVDQNQAPIVLARTDRRPESRPVTRWLGLAALVAILAALAVFWRGGRHR